MTRLEPQWCSRGEGCTNSFTPHRWGKTKATAAGWFLQRNGAAWCPEHIPDWVQNWREKKE